MYVFVYFCRQGYIDGLLHDESEFAAVYPPVASCCLLTLTPACVVWTSSIPTITAQQLRLSRDSILSSSSSSSLAL